VLATMLAHQAMGTIFTFLFPLPAAWYTLALKLPEQFEWEVLRCHEACVPIRKYN
jgi:hypothetical protein